MKETRNRAAVVEDGNDVLYGTRCDKEGCYILCCVLVHRTYSVVMSRIHRTLKQRRERGLLLTLSF
jgi:hypothetical protein